MPSSQFDVVGIGENSVDVVYRVPSAAMPNAKLHATMRRVSCGGQVATTMAACAAMGLRTSYVGTFGSDDHGLRIQSALAARGVDLSHALVRDAPNRHAVILVDERNGDRTVIWQRDSRLELSPSDVPAAAIAVARLLHVDDLDEDASIAAAVIARAAGRPVTADIDRLTPRTLELAASVDVAIFSSNVPTALTGEADAEQALRKLRPMLPAWLCVTLGTRGAMLLEGDHLYHAAAPRVDAVDTTGAGDVFRAAFISGLLKQYAPQPILEFATAVAAVACTREGAIDSVPELADVERATRHIRPEP